MLEAEPTSRPAPPAGKAADVAAAELDALWRRLAANPSDREAADALVRLHVPLVQAELGRVRARLPKHVDWEELEAAGLEAVFHALSNYDAGQGVSFEAYARKRVWGAMIDRLRRLDGVPRTALRASKRLATARRDFTQRTGRAPAFEELAAEAGVSEQDLTRLESRAQITTTLSLDAASDSSHSDEDMADLAGIEQAAAVDDNPLARLANDETKAHLAEGLKALPERERAILVLYYHEGVMFSEIAAAMEISKSRVSQMHAAALARLKQFLTSHEQDAGQTVTASPVVEADGAAAVAQLPEAVAAGDAATPTNGVS